MTFVVDIVQNASSILVVTMIVMLLAHRFPDQSLASNFIFGTGLGLAGLISMAFPVTLWDGIIMDARNAVIPLSAVLAGPFGLTLTATPLAIMRWTAGGAGAVSGLIAIALGGFGGLLVWAYLKRTGTLRLTQTHIFVTAALAAILPVTSLVMLRGAMPTDLFHALALAIPLTNGTGVMLLGTIILRDKQRRWALNGQEESQAKLRGIANNLPGALFQMSLRHADALQWHYMSEGARRILGHNPSRFLDQPGLLERLMSERDWARLHGDLETSMNGLTAIDTTVQIFKPDNREAWIQITAEPRHTENGRFVWDGCLFDVTQRVQAERIKNDFVSVVSHELRTPITSISGSLALLANGAAGSLPVTADRLMQIAHQNCQRLVRLINDILDMERLKTDMLSFSMQPNLVRDMVQSAIETARDYMPEKGVHLSFQDRTKNARILSDPDRMHQILLNLTTNAIKFSPAATTVNITAQHLGRQIEIRVTDEGPGIAAPFRDKVFEPFEQADGTSTRQHGGTGLGLSIVKALAEKMDGTVGFTTRTKSEADEQNGTDTDTGTGTGTEFFLRFAEFDPPADQSTPISRISVYADGKPVMPKATNQSSMLPAHSDTPADPAIAQQKRQRHA